MRVSPKTTLKVTYFLDHTTSTSWKAIGYTFFHTSVPLRQNEQQGEAQNWCQQKHQQREHNHGCLPEYSSHPRMSPFDAWNTIGNHCAHEMFSCWDPLATGHKDSLPSSSAIFYQQSAVELKFEAFTLAHVCWRSAPGSNCSARPVRAPWRAHWEASHKQKIISMHRVTSRGNFMYWIMLLAMTLSLNLQVRRTFWVAAIHKRHFLWAHLRELHLLWISTAYERKVFCECVARTLSFLPLFRVQWFVACWN